MYAKDVVKKSAKQEGDGAQTAKYGCAASVLSLAVLAHLAVQKQQSSFNKSIHIKYLL